MLMPRQGADLRVFTEILAPHTPTEISLPSDDAAALTHVAAVLGTSASVLISDSLREIHGLTPDKRAESIRDAAAVADTSITHLDMPKVAVSEIHWRQAALLGEGVGVSAARLTLGVLLRRVSAIRNAADWPHTVARFNTGSSRPLNGMANLEL